MARALIYFQKLMLRDFVALISPCGLLTESGDGRESYADKRTVPRCMAFHVKSLGVGPGHVAPLGQGPSRLSWTLGAAMWFICELAVCFLLP